MTDSHVSARPGSPLAGITVIDFTIALAGPFATLLLAGLGARVIKVENPGGGDSCRSNAPNLGEHGATLTREGPDSISVSALNRLRNKEAITLNLKHPEAKGLCADLIRHADIVVENFSRGTMDRLGVGYEFARGVNPKIVYCAITGFGSEGHDGGGKAMDAIVQALSGVMMTSGNTGDPPIRVGVPFGDLCAPLFGVIGILSALREAERTGIGQMVDVSMLGTLTSMAAAETFDLLERCGVPQRTGQTVPRLAPFGVYPTADGYVAICAPTEAFAKSLFEAMGRSELYADPKFATRDQRVVNEPELNRLIETFMRARTTPEAVAALEAAGVPAAEVRKPADAVRDPRVRNRMETVALDHPKFGRVDDVIGMGVPIRFSESTVGFNRPAPGLGEHTDAILGQVLGYPADRIADLRARKVI